MEIMSIKDRTNYFYMTGKEHIIYLNDSKILRVAVYARVSTEHKEQLEALDNQIAWYRDEVARHSNWIYDETTCLYVDGGESATLAKGRNRFLDMIEDAKDNKFDIVITREVCRFARNVEETFRYTRLLKQESGVGVYFISDGVWSFDDSTEGIVKLGIMATLAQSESKKVSERAKAGQSISRKNGQIYGNGNILGYDLVFDHRKKDIDPETGREYGTTSSYIINDSQAKTVRFIYECCLNNMGLRSIRMKLMSRGYLTSSGDLKWSDSKISRILNNPTYMGYNAYGKSVVIDYLSHIVKLEHELSNLQLVKGRWKPIISEEEWWKAQESLASRVMTMKKRDDTVTKYGIICAENMWLRKLQCECGRGFNRLVWRRNKLSEEEVTGYRCYHQIETGNTDTRRKKGLPLDNACDVQAVQECKLDLMAKKVFELVWVHRKDSVYRALEMITTSYVEGVSSGKEKETSILSSISKVDTALVNLSMSNALGEINENIYKISLEKFNQRRESLQRELDELNRESEQQIDKSEVLGNIEQALNTYIDLSVPIISYDMIDRFVNKVICRSESEFVWIMNFNILKNLKPVERINHFSQEYKDSLKCDDNFNIFYEFQIGFEECQEYMRTRKRRIVKRGWDTIKVKVAYQL